MQVTKLRLSGFKSFVEPTELLIEPGLTGVVGPNGCGKSNLVDALRWVMGEASARGLRGGEMDDVIFAGSTTRAAFDLAEVKLNLRDAAVELPGLGQVDDELELSRRIGRGAGSVFRANGKELRARDVQLLFADAASGARSTAIVTQGRVTNLVEAKPSERRRLLEDAAGIGGLQARRHEAELKLQAAEANLARVQDLLVTLAEQHEALRKQARQADRYRKLSADCRETEATLLVARWRRAEALMAATEQSYFDGREAVTRCERALAEARAERDRTAAALATLRAHQAELTTEHARLLERAQAVGAERTRLETERAQLEARTREIDDDRRQAEADLVAARAASERLDNERQTLARDREQLVAASELPAARTAAATAALAVAEEQLRAALAAGATLAAARQQQEAQAAEISAALATLEAASADNHRRLAQIEDAAGANTVDATEMIAGAEVVVAEATADGATAEADLTKALSARDGARAAFEAAAAESRTVADLQLGAEQESERRKQEQARLQARDLELHQRRQRLEQRLAELATRAAAQQSRREAIDLDQHRARQDRTAEQLAAFEDALARAKQEKSEIDGNLASALAAVQSARSRLDRLEAEAAALDSLNRQERAYEPVIDAIQVADGDADALAAALGDDLLAGLDQDADHYWRTDPAPAPAAPPLPDGCQPLSELVTAPPALQRRLAQVGLVDADLAPQRQPALAQGQRLVSRTGGLWRWDGLVRHPDTGDQAAARLHQRNRQRQLAGELETGREQLEAAEVILAAAAEAERTAAAALDHQMTLRDSASAEQQGARDALARARATTEVLAVEIAARTDEQATIAADLAEVDDGRRTIADQVAALEAATAGDEATARTEAVLAATQHRDRCDQVARTAEAAHAEAAAGAAEARRRLDQARETLDRGRAELQRQTAAVQHEIQERARIEAQLNQLASERAGLLERQGAVEQATHTTAADQADHDQALATAERAAIEARAQHRDAALEQTRLSDRLSAIDDRTGSLAEECAHWQSRIETATGRLAELDRRGGQLNEERERLAQAVDQARSRRPDLDDRLATLDAQIRTAAAEVAAAAAASDAAQNVLDQSETERVAAHELGARLEAAREQAVAEAGVAEAALQERAEDVPEEDDQPPLDATAIAELEARLARLTASRERLGPVNLRAIEEAEGLGLRIETMQTEQTELTAAIERLRRAISTLNREGRERLRAAFVEVEKHFEALFRRIFGGGQARLSLTDLEDPLAAGLELAASPPGKRLQSISLLSGGEKTLTALALLFAVFLTRPAPLCVLDEVDAPLDDANVDRLVRLLEELTLSTRTRFLVITHHPLTMGRMDRLYGVTMVERGASQLVSVDLRAAIELRATA